MKQAWMIACALFFISVAGIAQTPSQTPLSGEVLAAILGPAATGSCVTPQSRVLFTSGGGVHQESACNATATCQSGTVSCSGNSTCSAADSDCPDGFAGWVTCDGHTTNCAACNCSSYFGHQRFCCLCGQTDDCIQCCRCGGGTIIQCGLECNG